MDNEKEKKYFEQVEEFVKFAEKNSQELEKLTDVISRFGDKLGKLKAIPDLNNSINDLEINIGLINTCSNSIKLLTSDITSFEEVNNNINEAKTAMNTAIEKLRGIDNNCAKILTTSSNFNLDTIEKDLLDTNNSLIQLNNIIKNQLVAKIDNDLSSTISNLTLQVERIKESFESYKNESNKQIEILINNNNDIKNEFNNILKQNAQIIEMFANLKNCNTSIENFMNDFINNWYDKNVTFFGKKKNNKDIKKNNYGKRI